MPRTESLIFAMASAIALVWSVSAMAVEEFKPNDSVIYDGQGYTVESYSDVFKTYLLNGPVSVNAPADRMRHRKSNERIDYFRVSGRNESTVKAIAQILKDAGLHPFYVLIVNNEYSFSGTRIVDMTHFFVRAQGEKYEVLETGRAEAVATFSSENDAQRFSETKNNETR